MPNLEDVVYMAAIYQVAAAVIGACHLFEFNHQEQEPTWYVVRSIYQWRSGGCLAPRKNGIIK